MNDLEQILNKLPEKIKIPIMELPRQIRKELEEIRIRAYGSIHILSGSQEITVGLKNDAPITGADLETILNNLLDYSYYAYEEELAKGYLTISGGHRIGVCGRAVVDRGRISLIKDISSLNLRRSREIIGAAEPVLPHVLSQDHKLLNTLIISPPKCGKTTLLRDLVRLLSCRGFKVGVCDERSEIAGIRMGKPSYDLGPRTDVMDGCPKAEGMTMLIRAMSPDVVVTDEIGRQADVEAIQNAICSGVNILTTIHGKSYEDTRTSEIGDLIEKKIFRRLIFLTDQPRTGTIREVIHV